jgi:hypothetical protein
MLNLQPLYHPTVSPHHLLYSFLHIVQPATPINYLPCVLPLSSIISKSASLSNQSFLAQSSSSLPGIVSDSLSLSPIHLPLPNPPTPSPIPFSLPVFLFIRVFLAQSQHLTQFYCESCCTTLLRMWRLKMAATKTSAMGLTTFWGPYTRKSQIGFSIVLLTQLCTGNNHVTF